MQTIQSSIYCTQTTVPLEASTTFGSKTTTSTSTYPQHLPEEWALKPSRVALSPTVPATTALTAEPWTLALLVCSDPQVFISCPVPTQIIHKVKCRLPFRVVTNLSTLSLSSVIHIDINEETNMCVTAQRQSKINEKKCGHQKPIIHSKLYCGNHRSVEIKWEGKRTKTTHLDWGKKGGAGMKLLAHTISLSLMEKNINI